MLHTQPQTHQRLLTPKEIVAQFRLMSGMVVADFGSGAGDFAVEIAQAVGSNGRVYAIDILESAHESLRSKAKIRGMRNIDMILTDLETSSGSTLPDESVDQVMVHNVLFQVADKVHLLKEAFRILKPGGTMMVVEWQVGSPIGPLRSSRIPEQDVSSLANSVGFQLGFKLDAGKYHYGVAYEKPGLIA